MDRKESNNSFDLKKMADEQVSQTSPLFMLGTIGLGILVPAVCGAYVLFYKSPQTIVRLGLRYQMYKCGMKQRYVRQGSTIFSYGEKNSLVPGKPTLLFIHGFTSTKLQWLSAFKGLRPHCHMIAMELPGHGFSSFPHENQLLDINFMASTILLFLQLAGLSDKKIHIIGSSIGGALAGIFSALHPDKVAKVTMICPAMNTPIETEFLGSLKKTMNKNKSEITYADCALLPQDVKGLRKMFSLCTYDKASIDMHDQLYQGFLNLRLPKSQYFLRMFRDTNTEDNLGALSRLANSIEIPSQVLWGKHDEIMHYSGAEYLGNLLPNCKSVKVLDHCGHAVDVDRPGALCKHLEEFILDKEPTNKQ